MDDDKKICRNLDDDDDVSKATVIYTPDMLPADLRALIPGADSASESKETARSKKKVEPRKTGSKRVSQQSAVLQKPESRETDLQGVSSQNVSRINTGHFKEHQPSPIYKYRRHLIIAFVFLVLAVLSNIERARRVKARKIAWEKETQQLEEGLANGVSEGSFSQKESLKRENPVADTQLAETLQKHSSSDINSNQAMQEKLLAGIHAKALSTARKQSLKGNQKQGSKGNQGKPSGVLSGVPPAGVEGLKLGAGSAEEEQEERVSDGSSAESQSLDFIDGYGFSEEERLKSSDSSVPVRDQHSEMERLRHKVKKDQLNKKRALVESSLLEPALVEAEDENFAWLKAATDCSGSLGLFKSRFSVFGKYSELSIEHKLEVDTAIDFLCSREFRKGKFSTCDFPFCEAAMSKKANFSRSEMLTNYKKRVKLKQQSQALLLDSNAKEGRKLVSWKRFTLEQPVLDSSPAIKKKELLQSSVERNDQSSQPKKFLNEKERFKKWKEARDKREREKIKKRYSR